MSIRTGLRRGRRMGLAAAVLVLSGACQLAGSIPASAQGIAEILAQCQNTSSTSVRRLDACARLIDDKSVDVEIRIEAMLNRGTVLESQGEDMAAIEQYTLALELDPANALAHFNRANVLDLIGQTERALRDYDRAIELDPSDPDFYSNRGLALLEAGNAIKAIEDFDRALKLGSPEAATLVARAAAYEKAGRSSAAIDDYRKALALESSNAEAAEGLERLNGK
jgi:tetratricopeptide (TPR) repeat protein